MTKTVISLYSGSLDNKQSAPRLSIIGLDTIMHYVYPRVLSFDNALYNVADCQFASTRESLSPRKSFVFKYKIIISLVRDAGEEGKREAKVQKAPVIGALIF